MYIPQDCFQPLHLLLRRGNGDDVFTSSPQGCSSLVRMRYKHSPWFSFDGGLVLEPQQRILRKCVRTIEVMNIPQPRDKRGLLSRFHNAPNERYKYLYTGQSSTRLSLPPPTYHQPPIAIVMEYSPSHHTVYSPIFGPNMCVYSRQTRFSRRRHTLTTFHLRRRV